MSFVRIINILAIVLLTVSAVSVYRIKYEAIFHAEEVARLERAIEAERTSISVLRAELARLTRPDRIEALAVEHLGLQVARAEQRMSLDAVPVRPQQKDPIAEALQALGLADDPVRTGSTR